MMNRKALRRSRLVAGLFCGLLFFSACAGEGEKSSDKETDRAVNSTYLEVRGEAQGTTYQIKYKHPAMADLKVQIDSVLHVFDLSLSTYNPNSLISQLNDSGIVMADEFLDGCLSRSYKVYANTDGAFNPAIYPLVEYWGFTGKMPSAVDSVIVDSLKKFIDFYALDIHREDFGMSVRLPEGYRVEFNAIAQGYSVDVIAQYLDLEGVTDYMVEIGGEVRCKGLSPKGGIWKIGIDKPTEGSVSHDLYASVLMENVSMATSGNYRKFVEIEGKKYAHTIDPKTGFPVKHNLLSVTVLMPECAYADAYATAFMVMGFEKTKEFVNQAEQPISVMCIVADQEGGMTPWYSESMNELVEEVRR